MQYVTRARWALVLMTVIAIGLMVLGYWQSSTGQTGTGLAAIMVGGLVYALAWAIGVLDSLLARRLGWSLALILLLPFGIGPLLYSIFGLRSAASD
jgi:ABC-type Co2+ transport system permease subunit